MAQRLASSLRGFANESAKEVNGANCTSSSRPAAARLGYQRAAGAGLQRWDQLRQSHGYWVLLSHWMQRLLLDIGR